MMLAEQPVSTQQKPSPIGGHFEVDADRPLPCGGGLDAFSAYDRRDGAEPFMAVRVPDGESPRAQPLNVLAKAPLPFCVGALAHGLARDAHGRIAQFIICPIPAGLPVGTLFAPAVGPAARVPRPWGETELLECLLRPAAAALAALQARHITHRAIRPNNVFQTARGQPVTLGCAWATSPGSRQPAVYEPAYLGVCPPACRDDGVIADDIYALGVLMVALGSGAEPLAGLDAAAVVRRTLDDGSAAAILGAARLSPTIVDLARGMLADDPEHRPSPALLADPEAARARRVAARPRRRAQRSLAIGLRAAFDARGLAHALAAEPARAVPLLRDGTVDHWLRRDLGETTLAAAIEDALKHRGADSDTNEADADALLLLRAIAALDPLGPPCWRGLWLWPGALGSALASATPEQGAVLARLIDAEAFAAWALARAQRQDPARLQQDAREARRLLRQRGWAGGITRLRYVHNPLLACRSAVLQGALVLRAVDILPALALVAESANRPGLPIDGELAGFLAARADMRMEADFEAMGQPGAAPHETALAQLRVLARLQGRNGSLALRGLATWLANSCAPLLARTRGRSRRAAASAAVQQAQANGRLQGLIDMFDNAALREHDRRDFTEALETLAALDRDIAAADRRLRLSRAGARRTGREVAASLGLIAAAAALVAALL